MVQIQKSTSTPATADVWTNATGKAKTCSDKVGWFHWATWDCVSKYAEVISERRVKPKKPVLPNEFLVHKYKVSGAALAPSEYCYEPDHNVTSFEAILPQTRAPSLCAGPQDLIALYSNVTENAKADVFAKANSPAIFDLAPVLAELGETLVYCGGLMKGLLSLLTSIRDGSLWKILRTARSRISDPESMWLEYRYAIMPLILTISDAIQAYKGGISKTTFDARVSRTFKLSHDNTSLKFSNLFYFDWTNKIVDKVSATARIEVKSQCDPSPLGMGLMDAVRAGYEVLPLSFVFNWFVGVEEWLTSLRNTNLEVKSSYVTTVVDRTGHVFSEDANGLTWTVPIDWDYHEFMMKRDINIAPPIMPLLQAENLSLHRTVDALSLIISIAKGLLSRR